MQRLHKLYLFLLEQFYPVVLIIYVEDLCCSTRVIVPLDYHGQEGAKHHGSLESVGPHNSLDPSLKRGLNRENISRVTISRMITARKELNISSV